jgi:hypothetical protein
MPELYHRLVACKDVASLRLTSRDWAEIGKKGLFNYFYNNKVTPTRKPKTITPGVLSIRPQFDDMTRIKEVSRCPRLAQLIRRIDVYVADLNLDWLESNARRCVVEFERPEDQEEEIRKIDERIQNMRCNAEKHWNHCDFETLSQAFSKFSKVSSLRILSNETPFSDKDLNLWGPSRYSLLNNWNFLSHTDPSNNVYCRVILAALHYPSKIRTLVLDSIPLTYLTQIANVLSGKPNTHPSGTYQGEVAGLPGATERSQLRIFLAEIHNLKIGIGFRRSLPVLLDLSIPTRSSRSARKFMKYLQNIRSLDFAWDNYFIESGLHGEATQPVFLQHFWPHLESLRITRLWTSPELVGSFLYKHADSLKKLSLIGSFDYEHSWKKRETIKTLLLGIRENLNLEKFEMFSSKHVDDKKKAGVDGSINYPESYDTDWEPNKTTSGCPGQLYTNSALLEMFVQGKCPWPMEEFRVETPVPTPEDDWVPLPEWRQPLPLPQAPSN